MNNSRIHDEIEDWMAGAVCEALSPEEMAAFEQHLAECAHCRALFEEEQKMSTLLTGTISGFRPDHNFERRILEGFRSKTGGNGLRLLHWLVRLAQSRPLQAACAVLLLAAMVKSGSLITGEKAAIRQVQDEIVASSDVKFDVSSSTTAAQTGHASSYGLEARARVQSEQSPARGLATPGRIAARRGEMGEQAKPTENEESNRKEVENESMALGLGDQFAKADKGSTPARNRTGGAAAGAAGERSKLDSDYNYFNYRGGIVSADSLNPAKLKDAPVAVAAPVPNSPVAGEPAPAKAPSAAVTDARKLIRNASLEIEVANFEKAADTIAAVTGEESGYIATQGSERGPNGKLQGVIVVKVPPANLERFLLKLRALGDLKNQTLGVEDVTKAYFDTDARLHNSQRMEARLLEILQKNTGKVSDLLQVEKELGRVREQIEQMQGQLKLYDSLVSCATVTISLREKDLNQPAAFLLREQANLSLFSKDVEKTFADAKSEAESAKAQTVESRIERSSDGRVSATLHLLFAPEAAESAIGKMKALGRIQNFNSRTERVARNGSGNSDLAKIERDNVELNLVIQRDEESAAQQTGLGILTDRVEEKTAQIKQDAASAGVDVKSATFNRSADGVEISGLVFRLPMQKYAAFLERIKSLGTVKNFTVSRREDVSADNAPAEITLQIYSRGNIVTENTGLLATVRRTLAQGFGALMWSVRMIGVTLAFIAPWALALGAVTWLVLRRRGKK